VKPCKTKEIAGERYRCFFDLTLMVIGGKWKPVVLYRLARERIRRFSDLRRDIPEVTERMLSRQLREFEQDGLIHRRGIQESSAEGGVFPDETWLQPDPDPLEHARVGCGLRGIPRRRRPFLRRRVRAANPRDGARL